MSGAKAYVAGIIPDAENRQKDDFYPTPREGTEALLAVEKFTGAIWEPACGDGAICRPLIDAGYDVVASDLVDRGYGNTGHDFLMEWQPRAPNIVTNPPFKMAEQFVHKSLSLTTGKVAMLLRLAWLEGITRRDTIYRATPIARVHVFSGRLGMQRGRLAEKGESGMIAFAWFVWEHGYTGKPELNWI
jgi:hypothetical protein